MAIIGERDIEVFGQIGKILQENGGDVNPYYPPSYFTKEANLNKFAKYKPIRDNSLIKLDDGILKRARYGLEYPIAGTYNGRQRFLLYEIADGVLSNEVPFYAYEPVASGNSQYPCRLSDFINYNSLAQPVNIDDDFNYPNGNATPKEVNYATVSFIKTGIAPNTSMYSVTIMDIVRSLGGDENEYYICADILEGDFSMSQQYYLETVKADKPVSQDGYSINIEVKEEWIGTTITCIFGIKRYSNGVFLHDFSVLLYSNNYLPIRLYSISSYFPYEITVEKFAVDAVTKQWYDINYPYVVQSYIPNIWIQFRIKQLPDYEMRIYTDELSAVNTDVGDNKYGTLVNDSFQQIEYVLIPKGSGYTTVNARFDDILVSQDYQNLYFYYSYNGDLVDLQYVTVKVRY